LTVLIASYQTDAGPWVDADLVQGRAMASNWNLF
jgi:hypothetical protein